MSVIVGHALLWAIIDLASFGAAPPAALPDLPDRTEAAIAAHFDGDLYAEAIEVANCESRGRARAVGDAGASLGVFQIQPKWWAKLIGRGDLFDPNFNARVARAIYDLTGDWRRWTCQPQGDT